MSSSIRDCKDEEAPRHVHEQACHEQAPRHVHEQDLRHAGVMAYLPVTLSRLQKT